MIKIGTDFSGVGAFDQALIKLNIPYKTVFACDKDTHARITYEENYGKIKCFPFDVYERDIPKEPLDIYMTSPPCQAFSMAGKRKGEDDKRGVLFYNSHEFITKNKPRYFIFENVRGLMSDANGRTFQIWLDMLGGKSVNGNPVLFPREDSTPYHIYHQVLNAKNYGVPQNRERVFIIGIRDDEDNSFSFPKKKHLSKKLKDVLEKDVKDKYFLKEDVVQNLIIYREREKAKGNGFGAKFHKPEEDCMSSLKVGGKGADDLVRIKSATKKGYEVATPEDSVNFSVLRSETRRGRVGKGVAQALETGIYQGVLAPKINEEVKSGTWRTHKDGRGFRMIQDGNCPTIPARAREDGSGQPVIKIDYKIRRLTPRECFRLMDFPDTFIIDKVSETQAYKQAGNSIVVSVLSEIISKLKI